MYTFIYVYPFNKIYLSCSLQISRLSLKCIPSASCLRLKRQPWLPLLHLHLLCPVWWRMWCPMIATTRRSSSIRPQSVFITRSVIYDTFSARFLTSPSLSVSTVQYYYSVRIFAGQEPSGVWVGWVTPDFHMYDLNFDLSKVRTVTLTVGDDKGNIHDRWDVIKIQLSLKCWPMWTNTRSCNAEKHLVKNKCSV